MALGTVTVKSNAKREICLLEAVTAANGVPSGASAGVACYPTSLMGPSDEGACYSGRSAREASIVVKGVGTGTVTMTLRLWGYLAVAGVWVPLGTGADADKGKLNGGAAIGEVATDVALHAEPVVMVGDFDRLYLEVVAIGGTGTAVSAWLVTPRTISY